MPHQHYTSVIISHSIARFLTKKAYLCTQNKYDGA